ncbi:serine hydrolase domain-containing protein [Oceanibium sediminis]|uniref:serine hydrolase domain-containing protein n=1 Tax=Oceanibium sediminis TaxID=2026339 RepID=UPI000DD4DD78|nr:serine hydrolase domain-containing protein [Oceanibium sediminis]
MTYFAERLRIPKITYITCVVTGLLGSAFAPSNASASELESYLSEIRAEYGLPAIAAAVVADGKVVSAAAVGTRVLGQDLPVSIDDRFHLGSNTKSMTATLAGIMVDEGKLTWESRVGDILGDLLPGMRASLADATLEQLLSNSSGVPSDTDEIVDLYFSADAFDYNPTELRLNLIDRWKENEIAVPEGSPFQYSNLGYIIAGAMIEKVAERPWELLINERIFAPLELGTARLGAQATYGLIDAPVGHRIEQDGSATPMLWAASGDLPKVIGPAGNANMSILDYAKWAGWNAGQGARGPALVAPETLRHIQTAKVQTPERPYPPPGTPSTGGYALGWGIVTFAWSDGPVLTHNGSNSMNLARIVVDTERDLAVVVTTNFPGGRANAAAGEVMQNLYEAYAK